MSVRRSGHGVVQRWLDDPKVEEIWINKPDRVFVARRGTSDLTTTVLTAVEMRDLVERMLRPSGRRLDVSAPFVDASADHLNVCPAYVAFGVDPM